MVFYSKQAKSDLLNILIGLASWEKHPLGFDTAQQYVDDLTDNIDQICYKSYHKKVS